MKRLFLFSAAVAVLLSCAKESPVDENPNPDTPVVEYQTITFEAVVPTTSDCPAPAADGTETKTTLVNHSLVHWAKGDAVKVLFFPNSANPYYNPENLTMNSSIKVTGANGVLTATFDEETAESCYFHTDTWLWGGEEYGIEHMYNGIALYPSNVEATSYRDATAMTYTNTTISYNLPTAQTAVENSFGNGLLFSYAPISDKNAFEEGSAKLAFENACALIKLNLPADASDIVSVKVASSGTALTGNFKVNTTATMTYGMNLPTYPLSMTAVSGTNNVTLSAPDGETLKPGGTYYIVAWPGTHSNGLTFTFTNKDGRTVEKSISSEVVLEKSKIDEFTFRSITFPHVLETSVETITVQEEGSYYFDLTSSRDWVAECDSDWLYIFSNNSGTGSMTPTIIELFALEQTENKTETITIKAGDDEIYVTVNYEVLVPELLIERYESWSELSATEDGYHQRSIIVKSNVEWTLSTDSDWLGLSQTSGGATNAEYVTLTAAPNDSYDYRTATIYLRDANGTTETTFEVTQAPKTKKYSIVSEVSAAGDLEEGHNYVIFFAQNQYIQQKVWKVNESGYVQQVDGSYAIGTEYTPEYVFYYDYQYEVTDSELTSSNNQYGSKEVGKLKSEHTGKYLSATSMTFTGDGDAYGMALMFANRWTGEGDDRHDIDIWYRKGNGLGSYSYTQTLYWDASNGLSLTTDTSITTRKFFFFEVELVQ